MKHRAIGILLDCMPAACMVVSVGVLTSAAWQVSLALDASREVFDVQESVVASIVAEDAAFEAAHRLTELRQKKAFDVDSLVGMPSHVSLTGDRLDIDVRSGKETFSYSCDLLPGAAPRCLGAVVAVRSEMIDARPELSAWVTARGIDDAHCDEVSRTERVSELLDAEFVEKARASSAGLLREDRSIGLLRLKAGTDRKDYTFATEESRVWRPKLPESGVCVVVGNLWIDRGPAPLIVELERPLTVVVDGNIYIGRSVLVRGQGRLIFVARRGNESSTFLDTDLSGGWSAGDRRLGGDSATPDYRGPVEGTGSIFLGLLGRDNFSEPTEEKQALDVVAGLVADAEVYVVAKGLTTVHGAVVLQAGITWAGGAALAVSGKTVPNIEREQVPGFRRNGGVRPGMLTPLR